ncbi:MAG TPA: phosphoribosyltransferase [Thermoanaerobaculia bacterium]
MKDGNRLLLTDRREAGRLLGRALGRYAGQGNVIVLALPRGGVPVAFEIARALGAPLDVLVVRKLGAPGQEELAVGAIASGGIRVLDAELVRSLGLTREAIRRVEAREAAELERRERAYRGDRPPAAVEGRTVIVVDDGVATGSTLVAAIAAVRERHPAAVVAAVPVGPAATIARLGQLADEVVCLATPSPFRAVGEFYSEFGQTSDEEVRRLLAAETHATPALGSR